MTDINVEHEKCIGCGLCAEDCSRGAIEMKGKAIQIDLNNCNECGHCMAICPQNAVHMSKYGQDGYESINSETLLDPDDFLNLIKFRRSIRKFQNKEVEAQKLNKIIEAGKYSPTAGNRQSNRFIVIGDKIGQVRETAISTLNDIAQDMNFDLGQGEHYRKNWIRMYNDYQSQKIDRLFFNAPLVIIIVSEDMSGHADVNGGIAASRMELMANALGLGVCYIGFLKKAIDCNSKIREQIEMRQQERFILSFVLGYPNVNYKRIAPRKKPDVRFL